MADTRQCTLTFLGVQVPLEMKNKLEATLFFKRCEGTKAVSINGATVTMCFTTSVLRQAILKKVSQDFKAWSVYLGGLVEWAGERGSPRTTRAPQQAPREHQEHQQTSTTRTHQQAPHYLFQNGKVIRALSVQTIGNS